MRLALVTNFCPHYRLPLYRELSQRFDLTLILTSRGGEWYWEGDRPPDPSDLAVVRAPNALGAARALTNGGYDAVVAGLTGRASLLGVVSTARARRIPLLLWAGIWEHPRTPAHIISRPLTRALYRSADAILTYGSHVSRYIEREAGRTDDVFIAPQAVENNHFRVAATKSELGALRDRLSPLGHPIVLYVGRVATDKGIEYLIDASARVAASHVLVVAGDGPVQAAMRDLAFSKAIASRVRFIGSVSQGELPTLLQASDLLVLPSVSTSTSRETWGLVVNEAMNAGLPVIASDAVGAAAGGLVVPDETGAIVPQRDSATLAAAIEALLYDGRRRRRMGELGRERVLAWNYDAAADAFEQAVAAAVQNR